MVPVGQIAKTSYGQELPLIWRRDRLPTRVRLLIDFLRESLNPGKPV
jgi:hypothetical protein